jgi:ADP-heptose:LPS heptosyltransferase
MKKALLINISDIGDIVSSSVILDSLLEKSYEVSFMMPRFVHALWDKNVKINLISQEEIPRQAFDLVIDLTSNKQSRRIVRQVKAKIKIGRIKNLWQRLRHWITYSTMVNKKMDGHIVGDYYPILEEIQDKTKRLPNLAGISHWPKLFNFNTETKAVAIHFGAHNPKRVIPEFLISAAVQHLTALGYKIILLGTEEEIASEIIAKNQNIPIYKKLSLSEVKSVILCSELFIGADSGILHIAAALDVPSIGIYGPNIPQVSGPRNAKVSFFEQNLECRPCNQNVECPIGVKCMLSLNEKAFLELIDNKLRITN